MSRILLVEPGYKNKYPPLGLMKISAYHKKIGDEVYFVKGKNKDLRLQMWDRIYITTLFTFYWDTTVGTIRFYSKYFREKKNIFIGGIMATILPNELKAEKGFDEFTILTGLLDKPGILGKNQINVDTITPDYDIIDTSKNKYLNYKYSVKNCNISNMTRGCIRKCPFCAVPILEPKYCGYVSLTEHIKEIEQKFGPKRNLMLMDNNILASEKFGDIVNELISLGYYRNNKEHSSIKNGKVRRLTKYIDFNQGTDARLLTEEKMELLSKLEVKPLRIAFDHYKKRDIEVFQGAMRLAAKYGVKSLSNYMLYNYEDKPEDLYNRILVNIELNEEFIEKGLNSKIWSFPMRFSPINGEYCRGRKYLGESWSKKQLRGVQCILNATHGVVGAKRAFFEHAFGDNVEKFLKIILMPEVYILNRADNVENKRSVLWDEQFCSLSKKEQGEFSNIIKDNHFNSEIFNTIDNKYKELYKHYLKRE